MAPFSYLHNQNRFRAIASLLLQAKCLAVWVCLVLSAPIATAETRALTLRDAVQQTLERSPQLAVFPFEQRAAEARVLQAGLRPNPELSVEVENIAGSGDYSGADAAEYTLALSQLVELGSKRDKRSALAGIDRDVTTQSYELVRLDVLAETTRRYIEAARAQALREWASEAADSTGKALRATQQGVQAGAAPSVETDRMRLAATRAQRLEQRSRNDVKASYIRLAASWGDLAPAFTSVQEQLHTLPELPALAVLQEKLRQSPQLTQYLTQQRLREAQLRLAESAATPDLRVGMGVRHLAEAGDNALVFSFAMPLAIHDRNQGNIAAARADLEKNSAEQALAQQDLSAVLQTLYLQAQSSREEAIQLHDQDVPLAKKALRDVEAGYANGRYSQLDFINAQQSLQSLQRESIEAAAAFHLIVLELERLTGESMTAASSPEV
jgi:cobalt-zinc-cadmium efflux system outer membrane protein